MTVRDLIQHIESPYRYEYAFYGVDPRKDGILEKCPYFDIGDTYEYIDEAIGAVLDYEIEDFSVTKDLTFIFEISLKRKD